MPRFPKILVLPILMMALTAATVSAQNSASAVRVVQQQYGKVYATRLVAVTGVGGQPQPKEWHLFAYDLNNPTLISHFLVRDGKIAQAVMLDPQRSKAWAAPILPWDRVKISSDQVFKIADLAARNAQVGFDTLDYRIMSDRATRGPVYLLELKNRAKQIVGYLKIEAVQGKILSARWPGKSGFAGAWSGQDGLDWEIVKEEMARVGRDIGGAFRKFSENVGRKLQQ